MFKDLRLPFDTDVAQFLVFNLNMPTELFFHMFDVLLEGVRIDFSRSLTARDCHNTKFTIIRRTKAFYR